MIPAHFKSSVEFDSRHPEALAIYCSDGRFADSIEQLLQQHGFHFHDTINLPGGPGIFDSLTGTYISAEVMRGCSNFLIQGHKIKSVFLLAHAGCGHYLQKYPGESAEKIREIQLKDMEYARKIILQTNTVEVRKYYVTPVDKHLVFELIP